MYKTILSTAKVTSPSCEQRAWKHFWFPHTIIHVALFFLYFVPWRLLVTSAMSTFQARRWSNVAVVIVLLVSSVKIGICYAWLMHIAPTVSRQWYLWSWALSSSTCCTRESVPSAGSNRSRSWKLLEWWWGRTWRWRAGAQRRWWWWHWHGDSVGSGLWEGRRGVRSRRERLHVTAESVCADIAGLCTRSQTKGLCLVGIACDRNNQHTMWRWGLDWLTTSSTFLMCPSK